jgi:glycosyltransferase involved in cell wall biosynthesis
MKIKFQESFKKEIVKLSVFVVTYNQEKYIQECLDSILMQKTSFSFEVIVGDDNSTDSTRKICEKYANNYSNVNLLPQEKNLGLIKNWVRVLSHCKGEYIALCEGDDYWIDPYKLQKQVDFLEKNNQFNMCVTNRKILTPEGNFCNDVYDKEIFTNKDILKGIIPHTQTMLIRNKDIEDMNKFLIKMLDNLPSGCDRILAYWCSLFGDISILPDITAVYRWSGIGVWTNYSDLDREFHSLELFRIFHKRLDYPDKQLFVDEFSEKCFNFIYYSIRRKQSNPYKFKVFKMLFAELSHREFILKACYYLSNKIMRKK